MLATRLSTVVKLMRINAIVLLAMVQLTGIMQGKQNVVASAAMLGYVEEKNVNKI